MKKKFDDDLTNDENPVTLGTWRWTREWLASQIASGSTSSLLVDESKDAKSIREKIFQALEEAAQAAGSSADTSAGGGDITEEKLRYYQKLFYKHYPGAGFLPSLLGVVYLNRIYRIVPDVVSCRVSR